MLRLRATNCAIAPEDIWFLLQNTHSSNRMYRFVKSTHFLAYTGVSRVSAPIAPVILLLHMIASSYGALVQGTVVSPLPSEPGIALHFRVGKPETRELLLSGPSDRAANTDRHLHSFCFFWFNVDL